MSGRPVYLLLEDGARFDGVGCGAPADAVGEVVFTTTMSGYQESLTDPSFAGQILVFTYPHIGNYGTSPAAMESRRPWARAAIMREARNARPNRNPGWLDWLAGHGIPAATAIDTRELVRHLRSRGAMRGGLFDGAVPVDAARERIEAEPPMVGRNLAAEVGVAEPLELDCLEALEHHLGGQGRAGGRPNGGPLVAVIDTGVKGSILRELIARDARLVLLPANADAASVLAHRPDAVLFANGPGDPAAVPWLSGLARELLGRVPLFGICLGHQLLCRAVGLKTFKLPFGHRGANHPVKDLTDGRIAITSQNHGFAVELPDGKAQLEQDRPVEFETDFGLGRISHVNLYDRTVEGVELAETVASAVQYHPEAGPGPHDSLYLFNRLLERAGVVG